MSRRVLQLCLCWVYAFTLAAIVLGGDVIAAIAAQVVMSVGLVAIWWWAGRERS